MVYEALYIIAIFISASFNIYLVRKNESLKVKNENLNTHIQSLWDRSSKYMDNIASLKKQLEKAKNDYRTLLTNMQDNDRV